MSNSRLSFRYAKSLLDIAKEQNKVQEVHQDTLYLVALCKASKEFLAVLKSPILQASKKQSVIDAIVKPNINALTHSFISLLIKKGREGELADIAAAFEHLFNEMNNITKVSLTTAVEISEALKNDIVAQVNKNSKTAIQLQTQVNENLIGGFVLEFNNNLLDASVSKQLNDLKKQFSDNSFVSNIR